MSKCDVDASIETHAVAETQNTAQRVQCASEISHATPMQLFHGADRSHYLRRKVFFLVGGGGDMGVTLQ